VAFTFYNRTPSFLISFLIIPSDAFGVTSIYLLLNTLIKILKFPLSIPVATNWVYISGICAGFFLTQGSSTFRYFHHLVLGRPPRGGPPCRWSGSNMLGSTGLCFFVLLLCMCYWLLPLFHPKLKVFLDYSVNKVLSRFRLHFPVAVNVNSSLSRGSLSVWGV
jgi:hypothetical protein